MTTCESCLENIYMEQIVAKKKLSETTISKKMFGKQFVKFAKSLFETTSCKILIWNDHLQNLQQIQVVKKLCQKSLQPNHDLPKDLPRRKCRFYMVYLV